MEKTRVKGGEGIWCRCYERQRGQAWPSHRSPKPCSQLTFRFELGPLEIMRILIYDCWCAERIKVVLSLTPVRGLTRPSIPPPFHILDKMCPTLDLKCEEKSERRKWHNWLDSTRWTPESTKSVSLGKEPEGAGRTEKANSLLHRRRRHTPLDKLHRRSIRFIPQDGGDYWVKRF